MRIFASMAAAINTAAFFFHQERFWPGQGCACPIGVAGSPPFGSSFPFGCDICCWNLSGGIAGAVILSALSYESRFLQLSI